MTENNDVVSVKTPTADENSFGSSLFSACGIEISFEVEVIEAVWCRYLSGSTGGPLIFFVHKISKETAECFRVRHHRSLGIINANPLVEACMMAD